MIRLAGLKWRISLPTMITLLRILLVPCIVYAMVAGLWGKAVLLFVGAALTDVLDGALARWWDDQTVLGACLDPCADKLLVLSCFFTLTFVQGPIFTIPLWFVLLVLCKELLLVGGIVTLYAVKKRLIVQPVLLGKLAMIVQTLFIIWLFACYFFHWVPIKTYYTMLVIVIATTFAAFAHYVIIGIRGLLSVE